jgi:hypothetical protein
VGDEHEGYAEFRLQRLQFDLHGMAQIAVERRKRLIEKQELRPRHDCAGKRHTLLLAAGQLVGAPLFEPAETDHRQRFTNLPAPFRLRNAAHLQRIAHILTDRHVREQRIALEYGVDRPPVRRGLRHIYPIDADGPGIQPHETADRL